MPESVNALIVQPKVTPVYEAILVSEFNLLSVKEWCGGTIDGERLLIPSIEKDMYSYGFDVAKLGSVILKTTLGIRESYTVMTRAQFEDDYVIGTLKI